MSEQKLKNAFTQRRAKELELLTTLPKNYKINTNNTLADSVFIEVSFESVLIKTALRDMPRTFEFMIVLDSYYPFTTPLVQLQTKVLDCNKASSGFPR